MKPEPSLADLPLRPELVGQEPYGAPQLDDYLRGQVYRWVQDKAKVIDRWVAAGKTPRRVNFDGLMPVPGDGRYEWQGFLSLDELPKIYQPKQGWFATANHMNLPADYPVAERKVGFEWSDPARWQRIAEVLQASGVVSSRSAGRRAAAEGGAYLNNRRITDGDAALAPEDLLHGRWVIVRRGKKTVGAVTITDV